ncbi:MAG: FHA domain-containing protein [Deltaproteobacteria bacterium]|nr:FHA domain-containing protein [Deltaproteobacteria bacterium]
MIADHDVSRRHARIVWRQGTHYVYDLGSANGIRVNGAKVRGVALAPGDLLEIGAERWRYLGATDAPPPSAASGPRTPRARNFPRWVYWALGAAAVLLVVLFFGSRP